MLLENPDLKYAPTVRALRLLGSRFFHEVQTGKQASKTKVYDSMVAEKMEDDGQCLMTQSVPVMDDDDVPQDFLEILLSQDDPDAATVQAFETEFEEFVQKTPSMHTALVSYLEARQRLHARQETISRILANWVRKAQRKGQTWRQVLFEEQRQEPPRIVGEDSPQ